ncbi:endonuclease domain-containing protein [Streptomyces sp. BBFR2]|uniref:endonuclease domain-containing protein n=1 Tax=Streptomyces sp. BBFR2 TaxID=3372854 RepID=UPI0037DA09B7
MAYLLAAGTERADGGGLMPVGAGGGKWEWGWEDAEEYCSLCEEYVPRLVEGTRVCRRCRRMQRRMGKYGLSIAKYNAIWRAQGFQCALCGDNSEACDGGIPHEAPAIWQIDHDHACCGPSRIRKCCVRGILCKPCNLNRLPVYEKWPPELRDSPRINAYLDAPPAQRPEAEVIKGRDDQYLPTSWSFIKDEQYAGKPALADLPRGVP